MHRHDPDGDTGKRLLWWRSESEEGDELDNDVAMMRFVLALWVMTLMTAIMMAARKLMLMLVRQVSIREMVMVE